MNTAIEDVVAQTRDYYDGAANAIYKDIWGENIHMGLFADPDEDLPTAMERTNRTMSENLELGPADLVLDVGCVYGAMARYLAREYGCSVLATNISDKELEWGRELTREAGLDNKVDFDWADFHVLPYEADSFTVYWSQEAFLHAADKHKVLQEAHRVLKLGGKLVFSELLVRKGTPETDRRRAEFEHRVGQDVVDATSQALQFWVDQANADSIGWVYYVAEK